MLIVKNGVFKEVTEVKYLSVFKERGYKPYEEAEKKKKAPPNKDKEQTSNKG